MMPDIVPVLAEAIWDTKADVKKAARDSLTKATALVSNKDIERFILVDNMSKLADSHVTVGPFIPKLLPGLIKVETTIGDPEARGIIGKAIATLRQVGQVPNESDGSDLPPLALADKKQLASSLVSIYKKLGTTVSPGNVDVMYPSYQRVS